MDQVIEESRYTVCIYKYIYPLPYLYAICRFHVYVQVCQVYMTYNMQYREKNCAYAYVQASKKTIILRLAEIYTSSC